jgi:hypothetical protein
MLLISPSYIARLTHVRNLCIDTLFCQTPQNADSLCGDQFVCIFRMARNIATSSELLGPANKQLPVCHQIRRRRLASILNANTGLLEGLHTAIDSTNERGSADRNFDLPVQFTNIGGSLVHRRGGFVARAFTLSRPVHLSRNSPERLLKDDMKM